jgi:SUMO ligase MMS21 Smc5/6 complex component
VVTKCGHQFCRGCILEYVNLEPEPQGKPCPQCRQLVQASGLTATTAVLEERKRQSQEKADQERRAKERAQQLEEQKSAAAAAVVAAETSGAVDPVDR